MQRFSLLLALVASFQCAAFDLNLQPNPALTPTEVVTYQLKALQENTNGDGIAATFRFASPANKSVTGPLKKFSGLFEVARYQPMLNHRTADVKLLHKDETSAELRASIVDGKGKLHWYRFRLSRQLRSEYYNCWMTDAVMLDVRPERSA
ncbi:hypothetical protein AB833_04815 [Chromatiales bacterium (ex Bugula neritina AB1)]|nr:hypothetical protein AB833_04815 [Chromatiales bacterium (ex Bugula neritina AB1)]